MQVQQNRIVELLAVKQNKSRLPQPRVPMFDGNPVEYRSFIQAFENLIESRTQSSTERLSSCRPWLKNVACLSSPMTASILP